MTKQFEGEENCNSKVTEDIVKQIRILAKTKSYTNIGKIFKIDRNTVKAIVLKRTWKHVL